MEVTKLRREEYILIEINRNRTTNTHSNEIPCGTKTVERIIIFSHLRPLQLLDLQIE